MRTSLRGRRTARILGIRGRQVDHVVMALRQRRLQSVVQFRLLVLLTLSSPCRLLEAGRLHDASLLHIELVRWLSGLRFERLRVAALPSDVDQTLQQLLRLLVVSVRVERFNDRLCLVDTFLRKAVHCLSSLTVPTCTTENTTQETYFLVRPFSVLVEYETTR